MKETSTTVNIKAPNIVTDKFDIIGTAPYVQCRFSEKSKNEIMEKQRAGSVANKEKKRAAKDFEALAEAAKYVSDEGWNGIHAGAFRCAMISACRLVGFKMTLAKLSIFIKADGFDRSDGTPLVRIEGKSETVINPVRLQTGVIDIRARPMWKAWKARLNISYDADQFCRTDVANLLMRAGMQVGVGEGRPDSRESNGMGWGTFRVV